MSSNNGNGEVVIRYPEAAPPQGLVSSSREPEQEKKVEEGNYNWSFLSNLFAFWRNRRERQLIEKIHRLEQEMELLRLENLQQACMLDRVNKWVTASTVAAMHLEASMKPPPLPAHLQNLRQRPSPNNNQ